MKDFEPQQDFDDLDQESKYLVHKAKEATSHSYAPYSKFHVGAALILKDGTVVTGSNQENASYPYVCALNGLHYMPWHHCIPTNRL